MSTIKSRLQVLKKAVFLDRDGVINQDLSFVHKWEDFHIFSDVIDFLRRATLKKYLIVIVTNQSGIARGLYKEKDFKILMRHFEDYLLKFNIKDIKVIYCPHHPDGKVSEFRQYCDCRKPGVGMIKRAKKNYGIDLSRSIMVGDNMSDVLAGRSSGIRDLYLIRRNEGTNLKISYPVAQIQNLQSIVLHGC